MNKLPKESKRADSTHDIAFAAPNNYPRLHPVGFGNKAKPSA
jgi:hypothetical protein